MTRTPTVRGAYSQWLATINGDRETVWQSRTAPLPPGTIVDDRYRIIALLGDGLSGHVYRARQIALERDVALKVLHAHRSGDPMFVRRFHTEAKLASEVDGPHVAAVYDFGRALGSLYLAMQLIEGPLLEDALYTERFELQRACELARQLCEGLGTLHAAGIVHADVKPENVVVTRSQDSDERLVLIDFGISRRIMEAVGGERRWSREGLIAGTPGYIAPEVIDGAAPTTAADIYAAGVVLFELLTGTSPFEGSSLELLRQTVYESPPVPSSRREGIPAAIDEICLRALARDPAERFSSAAELARALSEHTSSAGAGGGPAQGRATAPLARTPSAVERLVAVFDGGGADAVVRVTTDGGARSTTVARARDLAAKGGARIVVIRPDGSGQPVLFAPIREALAQLVDVPPHLPPPAISEALVVRLGVRPELAGALDMLADGALLVADSPEQRRELCLRGVLDVVDELVDERVTLVWEDACDYDDASREIVAALVDRVPLRGARMVVTTRPDDELLGNVPQLDLEEHEAHAPVDAVALGLAALPDEARQLVEAVAVLGLRVPRPWLESIADSLHIRDVGESVAAAVGAGILIDTDEGVELASRSLRELVYAGVAEPERCRVHGLAAARSGPPLVSGRHALMAGDYQRAAELLCVAGDVCGRFADGFGELLAYRDAFRAALAAGEDEPSASAADLALRAGVGLAAAYCKQGHIDTAAAVLTSVCAPVAGSGDDDWGRLATIDAWAAIAFARGQVTDAIRVLRDHLPNLRGRPTLLARGAIRLAELLAAASEPGAAATELIDACRVLDANRSMLEWSCRLRAAASRYWLDAGCAPRAAREARLAAAAAEGARSYIVRWYCLVASARALQACGDSELARRVLCRARAELTRGAAAHVVGNAQTWRIPRAVEPSTRGSPSTSGSM